MKTNILVTRPNSDPTTKIISIWAKKIVDIAKTKKYFVIDLPAQKANLKEFIKAIKENPQLIFINGHGNDDVVTGQNQEILVQKGENEEILKNKIVYALSCRSGKKLGPASVKSGANAYIGYDEDFIFLYDEKYKANPALDKTIALFLDPSNQVMISLLEGKTTGESHQASKESYGRQIKKLLSSKATKIESASVRYLLWDQKHQVCCGDRKVKIKNN